MHQFNIGDKVETIDDHITGTVVAVKAAIIAIKDDDGFIYELDPTTLMYQTPSNLGTRVSFDEVDRAKLQKQGQHTKKRSKAHLRNSERSFTVDLHIEKLVESTKGMSNYDMLNLQLEIAKRQLDFAIKQRMLKMVFIHGVGEGVLKMELYTLLRRYDNLQFYDADFKTYGFGATEVRLFRAH